MKVFGIIALVLLVAVVGAGCSFQCGSPSTSGTQPATGPSSTSAPEAAAGPKVVSLEVGDEYRAEGQEVTHATLEFIPETKEIYVVAAITGLATGDKVTGALHAVAVTTKEG